MGLYDVDGYIDALSWTEQLEQKEKGLLFEQLSKTKIKSIPNSFDLRTQGGASPVKDKGKTPEGIGICWLFSGLASAESHLLYKLKADPADVLNIFSEMHGAYATFEISEGAAEYYNPKGRKPGVKSTGLPAYGGHRYMEINYLVRDLGMVSWCVDPYSKADVPGQKLPKRKQAITDSKPQSYCVKELRYLPDPILPGDPLYLLQIKYHIEQYGGVACSIFWDDKYLNTLSDGQYAYHNYTPGRGSNHAVNIMGWDDDYPVSNFHTANPPKKPGAFLVKNCWGDPLISNVPGGGYFWVSYESSHFGTHAYCITRMEADYSADTYEVYQHELYGYNDLYTPYTEGQRRISAMNVFSAKADDNLTAVGFYACTACSVTLMLSQGSVDTEIARDYPCPNPGYYTVDCAAAIPLSAGDFSIMIAYQSLSVTQPAYIPLEINDKPDIYVNWDVVSGKSFVESDGDFEDIESLDHPDPDLTYGYLCLKAIVKNTSADSAALKKAYTELSLPTSAEGRVDALPTVYKGCNVTWQTEPFQLESYSSVQKSTASLYTTDDPSGGKTIGIVNISGAQTEAYACATIGTPDRCLRKLFKLNLNTLSESYSFTASQVADYENTTDLSGTFPVPGAKVTISTNDVTGSAVVGHDGKWEIKKFALYNALDGWKDSYADTKIQAVIQSKEDLVLSGGQLNAALKNPADKKDDGWETWTVTGFFVAAAAAATIGGIIYIKKNMAIPAGVGGVAQGGPNVDIDGGGHEIEMQDQQPLLREGRNFNGVRKRVSRYVNLHNADGLPPADIPANWGGLAEKITKGGSVIDCHVYGEVDGITNMGGLFYTGENVTVKNCSVDLKVKNGSGSYAGVAVHLNGSGNLISHVHVTGEVNAAKAAGLASFIAGGKADHASVDLTAEGSAQAVGLFGEAVNTDITASAVTGTFTAKGVGGAAAGITAVMKGGSVKNCRVSAVLSASAHAAGIAASMQDAAQISHSYSACCLTGLGDCIVSGIAGGIAGSGKQVDGCVSICSHLSGNHIARIAWNGSANSVAYHDMTCDAGQSFHTDTETLKEAPEFFKKSMYEQLGWDFAVWQFDDKDLYPSLRDAKIGQIYDYPFANPYPPNNGVFEYQANQVIAILGAGHARMTKMTWRLSPRLTLQNIQTGDFMAKNASFYLQIAALPEKGDYDLALITLLDNQRYEMPIILNIV